MEEVALRFADAMRPLAFWNAPAPHRIHFEWILGPLIVARLLARVGVARRALTRLVLLSVQAATPLAMVVLMRNLVKLLRIRAKVGTRRLLWYALSAWSVAEVGFFIYILENWRHLNSQTARRWQAVSAHSTEEKRKSSLERYLLALTQVYKAGNEADNGTAPTGMAATLKNSALKPGLSLGLKRRGMVRGGSGGYIFGSSANLSQTHEASTENLLKHWESSDTDSEVALRRLKHIELACWFTGPGLGDPEQLPTWLRRGNLEEWIAHYWFRGAMPSDFADKPKERKELRSLVDLVLRDVGLEDLPDGVNPQIRPFRIVTDPLPVQHRPLFIYMITSFLCPLLTLKIMPWLGFRRERVGGLLYWKRDRCQVPEDKDMACPRRTPLVFVHGLGVGLVPYYLFINRLSKHHSGDLYVPELPFLAMAPWESVPSAREMVAQMQDMLAANGHTAAHFAGHSWGGVVIGWMIRMSPSSVVYTTLMEPATMLLKADILTKVLYGYPTTCFEMFIHYFCFRELFTVNMLCRNYFWEQSTIWPEDLHVPAIIELAGDDHIVQSRFMRRMLEHEKVIRKQKRKAEQKRGLVPTGSSVDVRVDLSSQARHRAQAAEIDIQWCEGFFHGEILIRRRATERLFSRMRQMAQTGGRLED
mmetsp:Transcript_9669/g.21571  ORF Transcript_9669/g.21571 Transcript_9669/m.21571 type:complete len:646 (-) Transcript_9669:23-1960(-)